MPDELIVELEATEPVVQPEKPEGEKTVNGEAAKTPEPVDDLRKQLETLKAASEQTTARLQSTEQLAQQNAQEAAQAKQEVQQVRKELVQSNASTIENAIMAEKEAMLSARKDKRAAWEAGDYDKAAEADERGSLAAARLVRLEEAQSEIAARLKEPEPAQTTTRRTAPVDDFDKKIEGASPRAQAWLRDHKEYVTDSKLSAKAAAAHNMAVSEGFVVDSDGYFDYCEKFLGIKPDDADNEPKLQQAKQTQQRTRSMPAAPVSRDGGGPSSGNLSATQVVLTKGEQDRATDGTIVWLPHDLKAGRIKDASLVNQPIGIKEMARRKQIMTAEGAYDK